MMSAVRWRPTGRMTVVTLAAVIVALLALIAVSAALTGTFAAAKLWSAAGLMTIILVTGTVGLVVAGHQPRNPIGWLLAGESVFMLANVAAGASTLAAAALFSPARSRVQRALDQRFNRARYDADQTIAEFAARLKDTVDLASVQADLAGVIHRALEPAHVSVWTSPPD